LSKRTTGSKQNWTSRWVISKWAEQFAQPTFMAAEFQMMSACGVVMLSNRSMLAKSVGQEQRWQIDPWCRCPSMIIEPKLRFRHGTRKGKQTETWKRKEIYCFGFRKKV
jgi:hypothetical protein